MLSVFDGEALQMFPGLRLFTVVSSSHYLWGENPTKLISYVDLEKDVKWALCGSHFKNFGGCRSQGSALTPCVRQSFTSMWGKGVRSCDSFPAGPISVPMGTEVHEKGEVHAFQ